MHQSWKQPRCQAARLFRMRMQDGNRTMCGTCCHVSVTWRLKMAPATEIRTMWHSSAVLSLARLSNIYDFDYDFNFETEWGTCFIDGAASGEPKGRHVSSVDVARVASHGDRVMFWMGDPNDNQWRGSLVLRHYNMNNELLAYGAIRMHQFRFKGFKLK
jgi:hypothetical protein